MKLQLSVTPKFVQAARFCNFFRIGGITLLWWVLCTRPKSELPDEFKMEERIHSNQQTFLFLLGLLACAAVSLIVGVVGAVTPWWVWTLPIALPFALYILMWIVEILLPPYDRAYYDTCFEREAKANRTDPDYVPTIFSAWKYWKRRRKFLEGKR